MDLVIAVGPISSGEERRVLTCHLPEHVQVDWLMLTAPVEVTLARAAADPTRERSREPDLHRAAHARFTALLPDITRRLLIDTSGSTSADAAAIDETLEL